MYNGKNTKLIFIRAALTVLIIAKGFYELVAYINESSFSVDIIRSLLLVYTHV